MQAKIAVLPGDGIGPDVAAEAVKVLKRVEEVYEHSFTFEEGLIGGVAIDKTGSPLPDEVLTLCQASDAVLLAAVGDPKYDDPTLKVRPEQGLLALRKGLGVFANLRPIKLYQELLHASTLKPEVIANVDLLVVRELTGGIYFGERGRKTVGGAEAAYDTLLYSVPEVERVVRLAFDLARQRRKRGLSSRRRTETKVTSVDKANGLESSRLWRETAERVAGEYPDVEFESMYVDIAAMRLVRYPQRVRRYGHRQHVRRHPHRRGIHAGRLDGHVALSLAAGGRLRPVRAHSRLRAQIHRPERGQSHCHHPQRRHVAPLLTETGGGSCRRRGCRGRRTERRLPYQGHRRRGKAASRHPGDGRPDR